MTRAPDETRERRKELSKRALGDTVLRRLAVRRLRQTDVAREAGICRTYLGQLLDARKGCSLFAFLEISRALHAEPGELLSEVLNRRDELRSVRRGTLDATERS